MGKSPNYITPTGFKALQEEFKMLFHGERPKLVETVAWAAGNGDRSENGDYIYGKKRLREIDRRLRFLTRRIESAQIVDPSKITDSLVRFGATVTYLDEDGCEKKIRIVGEDEINPDRGDISWLSPLASAFLGRKIGDEVKVIRPNDMVWLEIANIIYK